MAIKLSLLGFAALASLALHQVVQQPGAGVPQTSYTIVPAR